VDGCQDVNTAVRAAAGRHERDDIVAAGGWRCCSRRSVTRSRPSRCAFRLGEASIVAPFEYTALAWGIGLDWFLWQTSPASITLVGAAVIIASGMYLIRRERVHAEAEHP
jgi:hypothetical protein